MLLLVMLAFLLLVILVRKRRKELYIYIYIERERERKIDDIVDMIKSGISLALVSDAGVPTISDPGKKERKISLYTKRERESQRQRDGKLEGYRETKRKRV